MLYAIKGRASYREIGNKKDYSFYVDIYTGCVNLKWSSLTVLYAVKSRASYTEIGNKKDYSFYVDIYRLC